MLRVVTLNLWDADICWDERLSVAAAALAPLAPDVVCLQEVVFAPGQRSRAGILADRLGLQVAAEAGWQRRRGAPVSGVAVLCAGPVTNVAHLMFTTGDPARSDGQGLVAVQLDTWAQELCGAWAASTHLAWGAGGEAQRLSQCRQIEAFAIDLVGDTVSSPTPGRGVDPVILGGDFNTVRDGDALRWLRGRGVADGQSCHWADAFIDGGGDRAAVTSDPADAWARQAAADMGMDEPTRLPARRIDHIFVRGWPYGQAGCPERAFVACDTPLAVGNLEPIMASDHRAVVVDLRN